MLTLWQLENHHLGASQDALAIMESRCEPLQQMQIQNAQLSKKVDDLNSHQSLLARLDDEQVPYRLLGLVSQKIAECTGTIRIDSLSIDRKMEVEPVAPTTPGSTAATSSSPLEVGAKMREVTTLNLNGIADGNITVSQFVGLLRDSQVFQSVELVSSIGADTNALRTQAYLVKCTL